MVGGVISRASVARPAVASRPPIGYQSATTLSEERFALRFKPLFGLNCRWGCFFFFCRTFLCGGSAPQPPPPFPSIVNERQGSGGGGSGPPGKHKSEQVPRAIKDFETAHRNFHTLPPVGHGSTTNRSPAGRQPASLLVSQVATCHLSVTCWQTASQATMLTSKQTVSQSSQPASQPVSQPNNQTICQPICVIV